MTAIFPSATIFDGLPRELLARLAQYGRAIRFEPGEAVVVEGRPNAWLHIVTSGRVRLERTAAEPALTIELAELGPGEVVGHHGILDNALPAATVRAITAVETFRLHHPAIAWTLLGVPEAVPPFIATLRAWAAAIEPDGRTVESVERREPDAASRWTEMTPRSVGGAASRVRRPAAFDALSGS